MLVSLKSSLLPTGMNSFSGLLKHSVIVANVFFSAFSMVKQEHWTHSRNPESIRRAEEDRPWTL